MKAEIIAIGSELLLGQIVDTNSAFIARRLNEIGIEMVKTQTVGDDLQRMEETIRDAIGRSSVVITTGGIGPTEDDLTREAISNVTGHPLTFQPGLWEQIEAIFKKRGFKMAPNNRKQAFTPEGSIPIENPKGTAPGFIVEGPAYATITLPGVPSEMEFLLEHTVIPYLRKRFQLDHQIIRYRVLRACGLGESAIGLQIQDLMKNSKNPSVGTLAAIGDIKVRITAKADNPEEADQLIGRMEEEIRKRLGQLIYGVDDETLQGHTVHLLKKRNFTLSVAEIFTGGVISQKLSGTGSDAFVQGITLSSRPGQRRFLNLLEKEFEILSQNPKDLARMLARQIARQTGTDLGLATTGIVKETQGKDEFRFETYCSLYTPQGMEDQENTLGGESSIVRERASIIALDLLRKYLLK